MTITLPIDYNKTWEERLPFDLQEFIQAALSYIDMEPVREKVSASIPGATFTAYRGTNKEGEPRSSTVIKLTPEGFRYALPTLRVSSDVDQEVIERRIREDIMTWLLTQEQRAICEAKAEQK